MATYKFCLWPSEHNCETDHQERDEAGDELSLCDFPIYSDAADSTDYQKEDRKEHENFEFVNGSFPLSFPSPQPIIFCGKLFYNEEAPVAKNPQNPERNQQKKKTIFRWKSSKKTENSGNVSGRLDHSVQRRVKLESSMTDNKRYYLNVLGLTRLQPTIELKDIKRRQSRRSPTAMFGSLENGEMVSVRRGEWRWLWRMVKALGGVGSSNQHANTVVKATFRCL